VGTYTAAIVKIQRMILKLIYAKIIKIHFRILLGMNILLNCYKMTTFMNRKEQGEIAYLLLFSLPLSLVYEISESV